MMTPWEALDGSARRKPRTRAVGYFAVCRTSFLYASGETLTDDTPDILNTVLLIGLQERCKACFLFGTTVLRCWFGVGLVSVLRKALGVASMVCVGVGLHASVRSLSSQGESGLSESDLVRFNVVFLAPCATTNKVSGSNVKAELSGRFPLHFLRNKLSLI